MTFCSGYITGKDSRTCGISWNFGPSVDIALQPLWARHYETFGKSFVGATNKKYSLVCVLGDDPYLVSIMTKAMLRGQHREYPFDSDPRMRNKRQIATTAKHWFGYSWPDSGADRSPANVSYTCCIAFIYMPPYT